MFRTDPGFRRHSSMSVDTDDNINSITTDVVAEIEKELLDNPYDMSSLIFLLYDVPDTALQRLLVYQRACKDKYSTNMNLLHEWMQVAKLKSTWRHEFLEALLVCQLYGIVRKLGFNIRSMKRHYQPDNIYYNMYINPTKKTLYKLCENINSENLKTLKRTLLTYEINTMEYDSCELVFLKLMSEKIISVTDFQFDKKSLECEFNFEKLTKLIQKLPGLESFAYQLQTIQNKNLGEPVATSSPSTNPKSDDCETPRNVNDQNPDDNDFSAIYKILEELNLDDIKSDSKHFRRGIYPIKDPKNIGLCLIINQEDFHLCDKSIEDRNLTVSLAKRKGSYYDKIKLEKTMSLFNFEVLSRDNLNYSEMLSFIKMSIKHHVTETTSIFMLCILSHGVRDHVFAADSVKVKVEDIQSILDSDEASMLRGIPKVLIIQACQVEETPHITLVADSPSSSQFYQRKSDFLVYWATSPEFEAFRLEKCGTIFIQLLCKEIEKKGKDENLYHIFTKVNLAVNDLCNRLKCFQVPLFKSSLTKQLYLQMPKQV